LKHCCKRQQARAGGRSTSSGLGADTGAANSLSDGGGDVPQQEPRGGTPAFLWHMLRPPAAVAAARVQVAPRRAVWTAPMPGLMIDRP
jgi:hypothetical protein